MKFYKILHKPTGMYYQPVKGRFSYQKTNLSKNGKIYQNKPSLKHLSHGYNMRVENPYPNKYPHEKKVSKFFKFVEFEWEIIEFEVS